MRPEQITFGAALLIVGTRITVMTFIFWVIASFGCSLLKSSTNNCGKTYPVEKFISANWLCETKEK